MKGGKDEEGGGSEEEMEKEQEETVPLATCKNLGHNAYEDFTKCWCCACCLRVQR